MSVFFLISLCQVWDSPPGSLVCKGLWKQVRKSHKRLCAERRKRQQQDEHRVHNKQFPQCYQHSYWEELRWALPHMPRAKHWKKRKCLSFKKECSHLLRKKCIFSFYPSISKSKHTMEAISVQQSADERQEKPLMDFQLFLPTLPMQFLSALPTCWITLESFCTSTAAQPAFTSQWIPQTWIPSQKELV